MLSEAFFTIMMLMDSGSSQASEATPQHVIENEKHPGKTAALNAIPERSPRFGPSCERFVITKEKAWALVVVEAAYDSEILLLWTRKSPWLIDGRYFFPRGDVLTAGKSIFGRFDEWGVYVDGTTGKVERVKTDRIIRLRD